MRAVSVRLCVGLGMQARTHTHTPFLHAGTWHAHNHTAGGLQPVRGERGGAAPGDNHVDGVLHRQLQLSLRFVGPGHVVLTERKAGPQPALRTESEPLHAPLHSASTLSACLLSPRSSPPLLHQALLTPTATGASDCSSQPPPLP